MTKLPADAKVELDALLAAIAAWDAFVAARQRMNDSRPDAVKATPAERSLYDECYKADDKAEREFRGAACGLFVNGHAQALARQFDALEQSDAEQGEVQDMGVPASPSGHSQAEPEEVSALRASVPNADLWGDEVSALIDWAFTTVSRNPSDHETAVAYRRAIAAALAVSAAVRGSRITPEWCMNMAHLEIGHEVGVGGSASAIETQSATTAGRGPQDESAAPQEDAHTPQVDKG